MPNYICIFYGTFILSFIKGSYAYEGKLILTPPEKAVVIGIGDRATFECSIEVNSNAITPKWITTNGSNVFVHSDKQKKPTGSFVLVARLEFVNFEIRNIGIYTCEFKDITEQKLELSLYGVDVSKKDDLFVFEMKQSILECKITTIVKTMTSDFIGWFSEDRMSMELRGSRYEITLGKLIILKPMRNFSGSYVAKYTLKVDNHRMNYSCKAVFQASPLILNMPRSINQDMGKDINITCRVISFPPSVVHWTVNDKELPLTNFRFKLIDSDGHKNTLLSITKLTYNDKGKYNCTAVNGLGNSSTKSILLRVKDPFEWKYPLGGLAIQIFIIGVIIVICARKEGRLLQEISNPKKK